MKGVKIMTTKSKKKSTWTDKDSYIFFRFVAYAMSILFIITFSLTLFYYFKSSEIIYKEVINIKEHVQYVEKSKTPTSEFLTYLNPKLDPAMAKIIGIEVDKASEKYLLPRTLICAIMRKESNINSFAISSAGAVGLMQVMPKIHKEKYPDRNLWHIGTNIDVGAQIWREYFDNSEGNIGKTFHAYLSKRAKKTVAKQYQNEIEGFWAKLIMHDYLTTMEREKAKEIFVQEAADIEKTEELLLKIDQFPPEHPVDDVLEHTSEKKLYK